MGRNLGLTIDNGTRTCTMVATRLSTRARAGVLRHTPDATFCSSAVSSSLVAGPDSGQTARSQHCVALGRGPACSGGHSPQKS